MKKYLKISFVYAILAMAGGVFYREFCKFNQFDGVTSLGKVHPHLFLLGMMMFLILALLSKYYNFDQDKKFKFFMIFYNVGVGLSAIMFLIRGITQVLNLSLNNGLSSCISGFAGIGHILTAIGIVLLFLFLIKEAKDNK